jgi:hypothetical protein
MTQNVFTFYFFGTLHRIYRYRETYQSILRWTQWQTFMSKLCLLFHTETTTCVELPSSVPVRCYASVLCHFSREFLTSFTALSCLIHCRHVTNTSTLLWQNINTQVYAFVISELEENERSSSAYVAPKDQSKWGDEEKVCGTAGNRTRIVQSSV